MALSISRYFNLAALAAPVILLPTADASACGVCAAAFADYLAPGATYWALFATVWFLVVVMAARFYNEKIPGVPSPAIAILLVVFLFIFGTMYIGPFGLLCLFLAQLFVLPNSFSVSATSQPLSEKFVKTLKKIAILALITFLALSVYSIHIKRTRSLAEYFLKWQGVGFAYFQLEGFVESKPELIADFRKIVKKGNVLIASVAAKGLAKYGQPDIDGPILMKALEKCRSDAGQTGSCDEIEAALQKLKGGESQPKETL